jgi:hypothetical protein
MAIALIASQYAQASGSAATTAAINTTGASLIVAGYTEQRSSGNPANTGNITDSAGNTWTALTQKSRDSGYMQAARLFYCANPTTSATHTFTTPGSLQGQGICVLAFSGTATTSPFDVENGATGDSVFSPGNTTPTQDNTVLVCVGALYSDTAPTNMDSSFTFSGANSGLGSVAFGYQIQTTATARNPAFTGGSDTTKNHAVVIASFKVFAAATTGAAFLLNMV